MKLLATTIIAISGLSCGLQAQNLSEQAWKMEEKGDAAGALSTLQQAADATPANPAALKAYAEFLDLHRDPGASEAYERCLTVTEGSERAEIARRLLLIDARAGDWESARKHMQIYREAGGNALTLPTKPGPEPEKATISIPGPLRSFARMAALSPDLSTDDLLSALARNVVTNGYQAASSNEALEPTEYLKLVVRYLSQARELDKIAGAKKVITIETCDSNETGELLRVLGYRMRGACGSDVVLETVNATRAFLTIDSGFPLAELEQSLRTNRPFHYDYSPTVAPVLYGSKYWMSARDNRGANTDFIDFFIGDPAVCRMYLGMSKLDPPTADAIRKSVAPQRLRAFAHVLDFYGGMFEIRNGKAMVPGGARSEKAWADMVGASPDKGAAFYEKLLMRDDGWMASYYDALARIVYDPANGPVQDYLTQPERLKRFYDAIRGRVTSPGPARPVFRANSDMLLLTTRLRLDPDGRPHLPGGMTVWRDLFAQHLHGKYDQRLAKAAPSWKDSDDVLEALFGLCRKSVENEPLKIYLALTDIDWHRTKPLNPATVERLARSYRLYGAQYSVFAEAGDLSDRTINEFLDVVAAVSQIHDPGVRADAAGTMQSLVGLWQIFVRQGSISASDSDGALYSILNEFAKVKNEREVFDAGRGGVRTLLATTKTPAGVSPQDRMIDLLAGTAEATDADAHTQLVEDMIRMFEAQRLISLTTIFELSDQLEAISKGAKPDHALIAKTAARISEIQLPRTDLSGAEKNALAFGYWAERHIENQRKLNLRALIDKSATDPRKLEDVSALLAPFLRDTLVGFNYIHYAPPGEQILKTNPLFVRSHDFIGLQGSNETWKMTEVMGNGWPASAGGKLVGSLVGLPYALAEAEQNFLIPSREQALIWGDLVPQILVSATVPRWWQVTPAQLHWVALHMDYAENAIAESSMNSAERAVVMKALENHAPPARAYKVAQLLETGQVRAAIDEITPSEMFLIAEDLSANKNDHESLAMDIRHLAAASPAELNYDVISRRFGTPKPTLTNSYTPELLHLRTFPTLMGYSSRILAETWESNLLYYATIADQMHLAPSQLNILVPTWTEQTVEHIFATHLEDWPALLRSLRMVGDDARQKSRKGVAVGAGL